MTQRSDDFLELPDTERVAFRRDACKSFRIRLSNLDDN